jgi:hypothetical protein
MRSYRESLWLLLKKKKGRSTTGRLALTTFRG